MDQATIFEGLSREELDRMLHCFRPEYRHFARGDAVLLYAPEPRQICVLLAGRAHLDCLDDEGNVSLLEEYGPGDVFGEVFALPWGGLGYVAQADEDCRVMFLRMETVCGRCPKACAHHSRLTENMFRLAARRAQRLALRVSLLSRRGVRARLLAWLAYRREETGADEFDAGVSWSRLADYLCADRTSLMRELRALRAEGFVATEGRRVRLLQRPC